MANERSEEGTRCSKAVYAQGIVRTVLVSPLPMVNDAWRKSFEIEVTYTVGTYYHCSLLAIESIDDVLQRRRTGIDVVAVELHGKASAMLGVYGFVPATTDTEVATLRNNMYQALVAYAAENERRLVGRMVVNDDDVEREFCLLRQGTLDSISDGLLTVEDRDDNRGLYFEFLLVEVNLHRL